MSDAHDHHHHDHDHGHAHKRKHEHEHAEPKTPPPVTPDDAGSQALSDALKSSFGIVRFVMIFLVIIFFISGVREVDPQHKAVILRFGKPVGEGEKALLDPGLHWAFPPPIDEVVKIPHSLIQEVTSTVGWYATTPEMELAKAEPPPGPSLNPAIDGYVITSDANVIHVRASLRYRITDPLRYVFEFSNAPAMVTNALNNALVYAAAHYTVDNALTRDATGFRDKIYNRLQQLVDEQQLGIEIEQPAVQAIPPRQLTEQFNRVLQSSVERDKVLNEARGFESEVLSKARSDAAARIHSGESDRTRLVESVAAEAKKFNDLLPQYQANPRLFAQLRQAEVLQRVMTNAQDKIFVPGRSDGKSRELRLNLSREPQKPTVQR